MMRTAVMISFVVSALVTSANQNLRELVKNDPGDKVITVNAEMPFVTFATVLKQTDFIVRSTIGQGTAALNEAQTDIITTYPLVAPRVLFPPNVDTYRTPGRQQIPLSVSVRGGTALVDGYKVTIGRDDVPALKAGADVILFLRAYQNRYWIAGDTGVFAVEESKVIPLMTRRGEHKEFDGQDVVRFLSEMVQLRQARK
jgi:hypothetical protein